VVPRVPVEVAAAGTVALAMFGTPTSTEAVLEPLDCRVSDSQTDGASESREMPIGLTAHDGLLGPVSTIAHRIHVFAVLEVAFGRPSATWRRQAAGTDKRADALGRGPGGIRPSDASGNSVTVRPSDG